MAEDSLQSVLGQLAAPRRRRWHPLWAVPILAIVLLATQLVPTLSFRSLTARQIQMELQRSADAEAEPLLEQLVEIDDPGLPRVAAALGDERTAIALAAADVLHRQLDRWTMESNVVSTPKVARLAKNLAALAPSLGPNQRDRAAELAERLLRWPTARKTDNQAILIRNCELVFHWRRESQQSLQLAPLEPPQFDPTSVPPPPPRVARAVEPQGTVVSGSLSDATEIAAADGDTSPGSPARISIGDSSAVNSPPPGQPQPPNSRFSLSDGGPNSPPSTTYQPIAPKQEPKAFTPPPATLLQPKALPPKAGENSVGDDARPDSLALDEVDALRRLPDVEVMRLLNHATQTYVLAAIEELQRRGFQARHLRLAQRMVDPDAESRRMLAVELPAIPSIDPKPWLSELRKDADERVRLAAETSLKSLPEPNYRERLRQMRSGTLRRSIPR